MLQNKIYQNFFIEIIKNFSVILLALSMIALTVRAVSFLDLIVDNGYPVMTYFEYSLLNLFGIAPKFIPLSFLLALTLFILKHHQDSEFVILWTSGLKKISVVNLFFLISLFILLIYLTLSTFLTPLTLNKSRQLLSYDNLNSFLPTVKKQQFNDSFEGFTFIVEKKINNEIQSIFLHDESNNLKNLSSNSASNAETTIIAENGVINKNKMILFNGQIISSKKNSDNEMIKFEQLNIDLKNLSTTTIKMPKIQETSTLTLLGCFMNKDHDSTYCNKNFRKEILSTLSRRIIMPFYIPVISLICAMLLIKSKRIYLHKISIFFYSFIILLISELSVRFTGLNNLILFLFIITPFLLLFIFYFFLNFIFMKETKTP
jgi:lipopolysaccharide export system permease protein